jgi:nucleoid-associated protein YgaU
VRKAAEAAATTAISAVEQQRPRPDLKPVPKVYVVKPGDSLWKIAKKELTSGDKWKLIYDLNKSTIGSNPDLILPGQKLVMPV